VGLLRKCYFEFVIVVFLVGIGNKGLYLSFSCSIMKPLNYIDYFMYCTGLIGMNRVMIAFCLRVNC
jgi:hypothetical protein